MTTKWNTVLKGGGIIYVAFLLLGSIILISSIVIHVSSDILPENFGAELLGVIVNGILTVGLLYLYYSSGKVQERQEESLSKQAQALSQQAETLSNHTESLTAQQEIMEKQQELDENLHKLILDIDGKKIQNDNDLQICVSNHGGGTAKNIRTISFVEFEGSTREPESCEVPLSKISDLSYGSGGNTVGPESKEVEMISEIKCAFEDGSGETTRCGFSEFTTNAVDWGIDRVEVNIVLRAEDQHGNTDETTLYGFETPIHSNMSLSEAVPS